MDGEGGEGGCLAGRQADQQQRQANQQHLQRLALGLPVPHVAFQRPLPPRDEDFSHLSDDLDDLVAHSLGLDDGRLGGFDGRYTFKSMPAERLACLSFAASCRGCLSLLARLGPRGSNICG